jgi:hypothetical protein
VIENLTKKVDNLQLGTTNL